MAQLQVEPKKNSNWWIWLLVALAAIALLFFLFKGGNEDKNEGVLTDTSDADSSVAVAPGGPGLDPTTNDWTTVDRNAPNASYDEVTDKDVKVRGTDNYAVYSINEDILFDPDKSTIKNAAAEKLKQIALSAEKRFAGGNFRIYGFTDSTGSAEHNKQLAQQRAESVQNWLIANGNVSKDRISVEPVGEGKASASNATAEGRAQNRRVEVVVKKK